MSPPSRDNLDTSTFFAYQLERPTGSLVVAARYDTIGVESSFIVTNQMSLIRQRGDGRRQLCRQPVQRNSVMLCFAADTIRADEVGALPSALGDQSRRLHHGTCQAFPSPAEKQRFWEP